MAEVASVIEKVLETLRIDPPDAPWEELSIVLGVDSKGRARRNFGYAFGGPEGWYAVAAASRDLREPVIRYLDELYPDGNYPVRILIQFNRDSGRYNVEFEDTDTTRWAITPANLQQAREALRPNLG